MRHTSGQYAKTLHEALRGAKTDEIFTSRVRIFLAHLKKAGAMRLAPHILRQFEKIEISQGHRMRLTATSNKPLLSQTKKDIESAFSGAEIQEEQDLHMLGGLVLAWQDFRIDGSIRSRLQQLQNSL